MEVLSLKLRIDMGRQNNNENGKDFTFVNKTLK
jgi:hypothetical protein